ncbi:MAG: hypothetical protein A2X45_01405 [Lentisphaerae bacterium GWF2_50_93]|nr:MAG: hypothetical protein A2X45_01405 [Lentisphaerae bacterium GWF2_50_93]
MKCFKASGILLTALALTLPLHMTAENLVPNGDFEEISGANINGWKLTTYSSANQAPAAAKDTGFTRGSISLHIKHANTELKKEDKSVVFITSEPLLNIFGGVEYELSFYAKSPIPGQRFDAVFYTNGNKKPHFYKGKTFLITDTWTKYKFPLKLMTAEDWDNRELFIRFDLPYGEVYVDEVALDGSLNPEQKALMDKKAAIEAAAPKNAFVNSGFELGWLGWGPSLYRRMGVPYAEKAVPSGIDFTTKYEGTASLRIEPNDTVASSPYPVKIGKPYTFSFYAKALPAAGDKHQVSVMVITPKWKVYNCALNVGKEIGPEWKRYSLPVTFTEPMSPFINSMYIRIDSNDNLLWIDAMQFEKGSMTDYETGVQAGILTKSETGLFSLGKPEEVELAITATGGIAKPLTVSLKAIDVYSNVLWEKTVPVAAGKDEIVKSPVTLPNTALGVVDVSLSVSYGEDFPVSVNNWRYCVIDGNEKSTRQNPLFGMENAVGRSPEWVEDFNERIANSAGAGFTRVFISSRPEDGNDPVFLENLKKQLARKKASGKSVMICIDQPKGAHIQPGFKTDEEPGETLVAKEIADFAQFAGKLAAYMADTVDYYQLLNEPNIWNARSGAKKGLRLMPPDRYARFLAAGSKAVHDAYPKAKIAANTNGIDVVYTDALFAAGAAKDIDVFSFHSYRAAPEIPQTYEDIKRLRTLVDRYAKGMPIINDEQYFGLRNKNGGGGEVDRDYFSDSELDHAGRILQNFLHHIASERVTWSVFSVGETLFKYGFGNPVYYYYSYGGYRFMSQTLFDIKASSNVEAHPSVRVFLFERGDGVKVVSVNTRMFGTKGGIRNLAVEAAFDVNGNKISTKDIPVGYLPTYMTFSKDTTGNAIVAALKRADFYGLDAPIRASFEADKGTLTMTVENCENKPVDTTINFTKMPEGWTTPSPVAVSALEGRTSRKFTFPINEIEFAWSKDYPVGYSAEVGDSIVARTVRLPSIFAAKGKITVDGDLGEWKDMPKMSVSEDNLSADFSGGKIPHAGPKDLSADASISWDDNNVYCAVQVTDDVLFSGDGDETNFWKNDSIQIYFDMQNEAGKIYDTNDAAYSIGLNKNGVPVAYLDKNPTGRYVGAANADRGVDGDVKVAYRKTDNGYVYEMAFPRAALPYLVFKDGSLFGFSILVNDNDGAGRKQGVTLGPKGTEPYNNPGIWKTVKMVEKK